MKEVGLKQEEMPMRENQTLTEFLLPGARLVVSYAERLLKDVTPELSRRKPVVAGTTIDCNHPIFVYGHLALYPAQLAEMAALSTEGLTVPSTYAPLFQMGVPCHDDPDGAIYPSLAEVSERFFTSTQLLLEQLPTLHSAVLTKPLENAQRRERFGTVGAFMAYILLAHPQSHLGQISVWRRCMGLGPC